MRKCVQQGNDLLKINSYKCGSQDPDPRGLAPGTIILTTIQYCFSQGGLLRFSDLACRNSAPHLLFSETKYLAVSPNFCVFPGLYASILVLLGPECISISLHSWYLWGLMNRIGKGKKLTKIVSSGEV